MSVRLQPVINRNQPHPAAAAGARHAAWVRTLRMPGRAAEWITPAALNLLRRPRSRFSTTLLESHATSLHFQPRIQLAWHTYRVEAHSHPSQRTIFRGSAPQEGAAPAVTIVRETIQLPSQRATFLTEHLRSDAVLEKRVISRIESLETRSNFLTERLERTVIAPPQTLFRRSEVKQILRTVVEHSRRVEDNVPRSETQVARRQAPPPSLPAIPETRPAERTAVERRDAVETVHTAPWMRPAAPAVNVDQITEQVIRQIDSRMIAWRERMGKF